MTLNPHEWWRVVVLDSNDEVIAHYGLMHTEAPALRVAARFADEGAVVQHQEPPTIHPWITQEVRYVA